MLLMLGSLLMHIGLSIMGLLIKLVGDSITGSLSSSADVGIAILCHVLVGLLRGSSTGALDRLGNVVGGVPGCQLVHC